MSSSNCCFLTCIQISQEADQVVWYSHLFQNFPQFIVIHTVKGFGKVNKTEVDVFLELFWFLNDPTDVGNLISGPSAFYRYTLWLCWFLLWSPLFQSVLHPPCGLCRRSQGLLGFLLFLHVYHILSHSSITEIQLCPCLVSACPWQGLVEASHPLGGLL